MLELLQFSPAFGLMNPSPFCMKVEVFLRLAGLPYRCLNGQVPMRMPKRKLPVLRDGATVVADSEQIITYLQHRYAAQLPPALRGPESARDHAIRRMLEEHMVFVGLWMRWVDDAGWPHLKQGMFGRAPWLVRHVVIPLVRRKMRRDLWGQGIARHTKAEICARGCADLDAVLELLGDSAYFGGDEPNPLDACVYAFTANLVWVPIASPTREYARSLPKLVAYAERMKQRVGLS